MMTLPDPMIIQHVRELQDKLMMLERQMEVERATHDNVVENLQRTIAELRESKKVLRRRMRRMAAYIEASLQESRDGQERTEDPQVGTEAGGDPHDSSRHAVHAN